MPFRRTSTKRTTKKRRPVRRPAIRKLIAKVHNSMEKTFEIRISASSQMMSNTVGNSFVKQELSSIALGDHINNRTGNVVHLKYINTSFSMFNWSGKHRVVRVMLLRENNKRGDVVDVTGWSDLYRGTGSSGRAADALSGDINHMINKELVKVLMDYTIQIQPNQFQRKASFKIKKRLNETIKYEYDAGNPTLPTNGRLYLVWHLCEPDNTVSGSTLGVDNIVFDSYTQLFYKNI